jgi:hypothetical protein
LTQPRRLLPVETDRGGHPAGFDDNRGAGGALLVRVAGVGGGRFGLRQGLPYWSWARPGGAVPGRCQRPELRRRQRHISELEYD